MKISTKGRYGARAMVTLAGRYGKDPLSAIEIAKIQDISQKYLESILSILKTAGLVLVKRGSAGGYTLSRPPEKITLFDVLLPLEDSLNFVHCTENDTSCRRFEQCVTRLVWQELRDSTKRILKSKTLSDLLLEKNGIPKMTG